MIGFKDHLRIKNVYEKLNGHTIVQILLNSSKPVIQLSLSFSFYYSRFEFRLVD